MKPNSATRYNGEVVSDYRERTAELRDAVNGGRLDNLVSFAEDGYGQLYLVDFDGEIFRVAQAVPEPGTFALVGVAALGFWLRPRRRSRAAPVRPGHPTNASGGAPSLTQPTP